MRWPLAEIQLAKAGLMLYPVDEAGRQFVAEMTGEETFKVVRKKKTRRDILNRLSHAVYAEAAKIKGDTFPDDEKAYLKYHYGIPTLIHDPVEGPEYRDYYERMLAGRTYEERIAMMHESHKFCIPVSSLMDDDQLLKYVKRCVQYYAENGIIILTPQEKQWMNDPQMQRAS